jgi:hypothetical protein
MSIGMSSNKYFTKAKKMATIIKYKTLMNDATHAFSSSILPTEQIRNE